MMAPKARKHLSADALLGLLRTDFADLADHRSGKPDISLADALMSAFAPFSLKSPSLLAFDKERTDLFEQVAAAERAGRVAYYDRNDAAAGLRHRFRFVSDVPLNETHWDLRVNFLECWEWDQDKVQHFS